MWDGVRQPDEESDYEWVREYNYQIQQEEGDERKTYVFRFEGGQVSYAHIHAKLTLSKRGKHTKGEQQAQDFPRPSKVPSISCLGMNVLRIVTALDNQYSSCPVILKCYCQVRCTDFNSELVMWWVYS